MHSQGPLTPSTPPHSPQQYVQQPPPATLQNPIPYQGVMTTQQMINPTPPQMGQYATPSTTPPRDLVDRSIFLTNEEILLQTRNHQYGMPLDSTPTTLETRPATIGQPLIISHPNTEPIPRIPCMPLRPNVHNPHAKAAHNYSLVDDLAQSPVAISVLEVLQTFPSQRKSLLSALGAIDTADTH
jgi:hypothetical protein